MTHRTIGLLVTWAFSLLAVPFAVAQQQTAPPRIGYLGDMPEVFTDAFRQGLRELGYTEGQNLIVEYRWGEGSAEWIRDRAAELAQRQVDVIVTAGTPASRAAQHATRTIPIVMAHVADPVGTGLVSSLARPGGNITGVSIMGIDLRGKQLELLKEAVPRISRVASLENHTYPALAETFSREMQEAARALGLTVNSVVARNLEELERAFTAITLGQADAIFVHQDQFFFAHRARLFDLVAKSRPPA